MKRAIENTILVVLLAILAFVLFCSICPGATLPPKPPGPAKTASKGAAVQVAAIGSTNNPNAIIKGLEWDANTDPQVTGYVVYFGGASGVYTNVTSVGLVTNTTIYFDYNREYYIVVTAQNTLGQESVYSNEVKFGLFYPDRITINWPTNPPAALLTSTTPSLPRSAWTVVLPTSSAGTATILLTQGPLFFCLQGTTNRLTIYSWNPLNQ